MAPSALAASSTVYPAGDTMSFGSQGVSIGNMTGVNTSCTMNGGTAAIPAAPGNHNVNGPVTLSYTTRPSFTSCAPIGGSIAVTIATSGTWQLKLQNGVPATAQITVPANGLSLTVSAPGFTCTGTNTTATTFNGAWQNGFTLPMTASTMRITSGPSLQYNCGGSPLRFLVSAPTFNVTDATNPLDVVLVGP